MQPRGADPPTCHESADGFRHAGSVISIAEQRVEVRVPGLSPSSLVELHGRFGSTRAVVRSVSGAAAICAPLTPPRGIAPGAVATSDLGKAGRFVGPALLGHVVDAWGCGDHSGSRVVADAAALDPGARRPVVERLTTDVAAIDAFVTLGRGQRVALFAGAGVGKTMLLRRIAQRTEADAFVVALVGERAREAVETIDALRDGPAWPRTTVVSATAEAGSMQRWAAAETAVAHARALAAAGANVLLALDSLTRVAQAWRELAAATGEAPTARGYPPSLPAALARIVEPAGRFAAGSVTAVFAVLSEADDRREPVTDTVRSLLDGHIELSRGLAEAARFPAIDVVRSLSRLMPGLVDERHLSAAAAVRSALTALERADDLLALGAYVPGGDLPLDAALAARDDILRFVHDGARAAPYSATRARLLHIAARLGD